IMEKHLAPLPIQIFIYPHRESAVRPEHETPAEIARWLRSQPSVLSFHEFWNDLLELLAESRQFTALSVPSPFTITPVEDNLTIDIGDNNIRVDRDQLLDLWQQLRLNGFASGALAPTALETQIVYLLPLLERLPYVRSVRAVTT